MIITKPITKRIIKAFEDELQAKHSKEELVKRLKLNLIKYELKALPLVDILDDSIIALLQLAY